jgi:uridine kinase
MLFLLTGASGSGKSTITSNLSKMLNAIIIPQDSFYKVPFDNFPYDKLMDVDIEGDDLIDWDKLCETVIKFHVVCPTMNVIVEGHRVFTSDILLELADVLVCIKEDKHIIKKRFMNRYSDSYSIKQLDMKESYFESSTWPEHERYVLSTIASVANNDRDKFLYVGSDITRATDAIVEFSKGT